MPPLSIVHFNGDGDEETCMVMIGVDAHKRTHTLVAVDEVGRKLGERTVTATSDGHLNAVTWAGQ
jgi:transposase